MADEPEEMTDEALERAMEKAAGSPAPTVEAEPEAPTPPAPTEPVAELPPPVEEAEPEPKAEEPDLEKEILKAKLEEMEAKAAHFESVAGRHGGAMRHLQDQLEEIRTARPQAPAEEGLLEEEVAPKQPAPARPDSVLDWAVKRAQADALQEFGSQHPDLQEEAVQKGVREYLEKVAAERPRPHSADPIRAHRAVSELLDEAYTHTKAQIRTVRRQELETKRADQVKNLDDLKKKASISGSGTNAPAPVKPKTPDEMTEQELDEALASATKGQRW